MSGLAGAEHFDTIVAPVTATGGAIAIVRLSGADAWRIASEVFAPWRPEPLRATYGRYGFGDDGLALPFAAGHSYTGEESVELSLHGSATGVGRLVDACLRAGARMAEPGEFTQRAFLNGRLDLTQAEGIRDAIEARTAAQLRLANLQREGATRRRVEALVGAVGKVLAAVEASVDFSEEIGEFDDLEGLRNLEASLREVGALRESAGLGRLLRRGLRVAIVGRPNAGKSSLLNALLGIDRAIVTDVPGTTRDFVEEQIIVCGVPVVLIDTAGLRETDNPVEAVGIRRAREIAAHADVVWFLYDVEMGWTEGDERLLNEIGRHVTLIAAKCDLARVSRGLAMSSVTGEGIAELLQSLPIDQEMETREIAIDGRHDALLAQVEVSLREAIASLTGGRPPDLISVHLRSALDALGQITGQTADAEMLQRIFADFCIGK